MQPVWPRRHALAMPLPAEQVESRPALRGRARLFVNAPLRVNAITAASWRWLSAICLWLEARVRADSGKSTPRIERPRGRADMV